MQKSTEDQISALQSSRALKRTFACLIDAMRSANKKDELEAKIIEVQSASKRSLSSLEDLNKRMAEMIRTLAPTVDQEFVRELEKQVTSFLVLAVEQTKNKLRDKIQNDLKNLQSDLSSERTKTFKNLEAFIATRPFSVQDQVTKVKFMEGTYEARGSYTCTDSIQYEVSYDTKKSRLLTSELKVSSFEKDIKIPVSLGKSWLRKDPVPDYERLDQYSLESAESSDNNLIVIFKNEEKDAKVKLVYSRINHHQSLSVEYADSAKTVDITANPGLNKFLSQEPLERAMERLWLAVSELENNMSVLTKLVSDGADILEKLECFQFFAKSWKILSPKVSSELKAYHNGLNADDKLSEAFVRDRLAPLGNESVVMLESLGLSQQ